MLHQKNIRIKDIAQLANVSVGTVDRVLHNRGRVSQEALEKVMAILNQIDYKPNLIARMLGSNKAYKIAALIPNPAQDPYWQQSATGLRQAQAEWNSYGVTVELFLFDLYDKGSYKTVSEAAYNSRPDAILTAPIFYQESLAFFELCRSSGIPYVLFNTNIPEMNPLSFIGQDLNQSGKVGAALMHLGNQRGGLFAVLHIHEDLDNAVHLLEKERGFREYFLERPETEAEIKTLNLGGPEEPSFEEQMLNILNDPRLKGCFVSTSKGTFIAAAFLERIKKKDITLVGYDMLEENLHYLKGGVIDFLINQNPSRQASTGIGLLSNYLVFKKNPELMNLFPLEIISQQNLDSYVGSQIH
jgi:LacI family transcriptional regulator